LQSVKRAIAGMDAEVVVVDNASVDDSVIMLKRDYPEVRCIVNAENLGFAKANNMGVAAARGEYVCILNPDTVVPEDIFKDFMAFAKSTPQMGAAGPQFIDGQGRFLPESKRNLPTPRVALKKLLNMDNAYYATHIREEEQAKTEILVGALLFISRKHYNAIGGFDESYYMYGEDIDFSYSITRSGLHNYYLGTTRVIHFKGESTLRDKDQAERFYGAMRIFYKKYFKRGFLRDFGVYFLTGFAKVINRKPKPTIINPSFMIYVGQDDFITQFAQFKNRDFKKSSLVQLMEMQPENTLVIIDAAYVRFQEIINVMHALRGRGNTFRIRPEGCNFILGSDSPSHRGEVIRP
tara:strand:- start:585 stop:1634 length:1050 start_codon:yes stop_codon:yes gene_type:complete